MIKIIKILLARNYIFIASVFYTTGVTFLLLSPSKNIPKVSLIPSIDKLGHAMIFLLLGFVWLARFFFKEEQIKKSSFFIVLGIVFIYGIIIEVLQGTLFTSRTADIWDVIANTIGIVFSYVLFKRVNNIFVMKN